MNLDNTLRNTQTVYIDVRTPQEFYSGHFPGARNIPLDELMMHLDELKRTNAPLVLYCRSGARSTGALILLKEAGLQDVYNGGALENLLMTAQRKMT